MKKKNSANAKFNAIMKYLKKVISDEKNTKRCVFWLQQFNEIFGAMRSLLKHLEKQTIGFILELLTELDFSDASDVLSTKQEGTANFDPTV